MAIKSTNNPSTFLLYALEYWWVSGYWGTAIQGSAALEATREKEKTRADAAYVEYLKYYKSQALPIIGHINLNTLQAYVGGISSSKTPSRTLLQSMITFLKTKYPTDYQQLVTHMAALRGPLEGPTPIAKEFSEYAGYVYQAKYSPSATTRAWAQKNVDLLGDKYFGDVYWIREGVADLVIQEASKAKERNGGLYPAFLSIGISQLPPLEYNIYEDWVTKKSTDADEQVLNDGADDPNTRVLKHIKNELAKSDKAGLEQGLKDIDVYLKQTSVNAAAKEELKKLKPQFESKIKALEAPAAKAVTPVKKNIKANPVNPTGGAAPPVKEVVEKRNEEKSVTKTDTKGGGENTSSPAEKINASLQVTPPQQEELIAAPATLKLTLSDPIGKLNTDPFYRTQLVKTDLNDFRRVQMVLPNNLNQGTGTKAPLASFRLVNDASSGRTIESEDPMPSFENPLAGGNPYNQFFLKAVDETRNEKFQIVDTPAMGQTLFGFGEKPEFWTIRGQVINDSLNDWTTKLRLAWANKMRISQLIENGQYLELSIPALRLQIGCYPVALTISHVDDAETLPSFAMVLFKRHETILPTVTYSRQEAVVAMVNSILSLDKKEVALADVTNGKSLTPTLKEEASSTETAPQTALSPAARPPRTTDR